MVKHFKFLLLALLAVTLMVGTAYAGVTKVNRGAGNTAVMVSLEAMGAARNVIMVSDPAPGGAANSGTINYTVSQQITGGNFLQVGFSGAAFAGNQVRVCKVDADAAGNQVGIATPSGGTTSYFFQLATANATATIPVGEVVYLTTDGACNTTGASANLILQLSPTSSASNPTVSLGIVSSGGMNVDPSSTAQLAAIRNEFAVGFAASNHTVDYLGVPGDGSRLIAGNVLYAGTNAAANITPVLNTFTVNGGPLVAAQNAGLTIGAVVQLTDTASWQGLTKVFLSNGGAYNGVCTDNAGGNLVGTGSPSGTVSLTVPAAAFDGNGAQSAANFAVCLMAGGNALSIPRTIQAAVDLNVSTGGNDPAATAYNIVDTWDTNAYQGYIPWLVNSAAVPTYCLISNNDPTRAATVLMNVMSSEGSVILSGNLGTIAAATSKMATFSDRALLDTTEVSLATLGADRRYAVKLTVTVNPNSATVACIQTDPYFAIKRSLPVLTNSPWIQ